MTKTPGTEGRPALNASLTTETEVMSSADRMVLTPEEVARMLGLHPNSVYSMLKSGELPSVRAGRKWLIPRRRLDAWLGGETHDR
jgi:excisionase family DNA binding protein